MTERTKTRDMIENIGLKPKTPFRPMFYTFFSVLNAFLLIKPGTEDSIAHIKKKTNQQSILVVVSQYMVLLNAAYCELL